MNKPHTLLRSDIVLPSPVSSRSSHMSESQSPILRKTDEASQDSSVSQLLGDCSRLSRPDRHCRITNLLTCLAEYYIETLQCHAQNATTLFEHKNYEKPFDPDSCLLVEKFQHKNDLGPVDSVKYTVECHYHPPSPRQSKAPSMLKPAGELELSPPGRVLRKVDIYRQRVYLTPCAGKSSFLKPAEPELLRTPSTSANVTMASVAKASPSLLKVPVPARSFLRSESRASEGRSKCVRSSMSSYRVRVDIMME